MNITSTPYINNILVNNTNATALLNGTITILGNMTVTSGSLQTTVNGIVNFTGTTAQSITSISPITFNYLTLNNSTGLSLSSSITVTRTLSLTNGALSIGANTLTFQTSDTPMVRTSGTITTTSSSNLVFGTSGNMGVLLLRYLQVLLLLLQILLITSQLTERTPYAQSSNDVIKWSPAL